MWSWRGDVAWFVEGVSCHWWCERMSLVNDVIERMWGEGVVWLGKGPWSVLVPVDKVPRDENKTKSPHSDRQFLCDSCHYASLVFVWNHAKHDGICYSVSHGTYCSNTTTPIDCTSCTLQQHIFGSKQGEQALTAFGGLPAFTKVLILLLTHFFPSIFSCLYRLIAFLFIFCPEEASLFPPDDVGGNNN